MAEPMALLGMARKAGRLVLGAAAVEQRLRREGAVLLFITEDASPNVARQAKRWAEAAKVEFLTIPYTKEAFGYAMGRQVCAIAALTDKGFAAAYKKATEAG